MGFHDDRPLLDPAEPGIDWEERQARRARHRSATARALSMVEQGWAVDTLTDTLSTFHRIG